MVVRPVCPGRAHRCVALFQPVPPLVIASSSRVAFFPFCLSRVVHDFVGGGCESGVGKVDELRDLVVLEAWPCHPPATSLVITRSLAIPRRDFTQPCFLFHATN